MQIKKQTNTQQFSEIAARFIKILQHFSDVSIEQKLFEITIKTRKN